MKNIDTLACKACDGTGSEADYVGLEMRCVEVQCGDCRGTGKMTFHLCSDCPPADYSTDKTRCDPCPRRNPTTGAKQ